MWAGHPMRRDDNRWTTKLTTWQPGGHMGNGGHQMTRWRADLEIFKKLWHQDVWGLQGWQELGKAYVQQRTYQG